jgi:DNA polymerase-3 subunit beta
MLFSIESGDFIKELSVINQVIPKHTTFPILCNIKIEAKESALHIFGTDLDTSMSYTTNLAKIEEDGVIIIPAKILYSMIREIKGKATFKKEGNRAKVEYDRGYFYLPLMEEEDFPSEPDISKENAYKINIGEIKNLIDKLVFIVPEDSAKRNMSGMLWEYIDSKLKMVVTDSFRLGYCDTDIKLGEENFNIVIPPKILKQVSSLETSEMWVGIDESRIYFIGDKFTMVSRLIKVDFPNYKSAIPEDNENILKIDRESFSSALRRVSVFSDDKSKTIMIELGGNLVLGASSEIGEGKEEISGEYKGKEINIALSAAYLIEILRYIDSSDVFLKFGESNRPVIIEGKDKKILYLLMPVVLE